LTSTLALPDHRDSRPDKTGHIPMADDNDSTLLLGDLEDRIAMMRDNIRQLIEQAAASSGAGDESRNADRIADQQAELDKLVKQRDAILAKRT
jgi:uncharacterized small protein (DUF1192 family)